MRIIFMGTPDFAIPSLRALAESAHEVVAVVTQPDRVTGKRVTVPATKSVALELGIPVLQYGKVSREGVEDLRALNADVIVTCSFGQILSREVLSLTPYGVVNVHGSILPKYRGSSPIQSAILNGDKETGITIMQTAYEVDSGDMILCERIPIAEDETAESLFDKLSELGAHALMQALEELQNGTAVFTPQDHTRATFCRMLTKESGRIDFALTAAEMDRFVRAMYSWPSAYTTLGGKVLKIYSVQPVYGEYDESVKPGTVVDFGAKKGIVVRVGDGAIMLKDIQYEGAKRMDSKTFAIGHKIEIGTVLGE